MRPPTASASTAAGSARSRACSSPLTSMRRAWKVRFAGCPPVRRVAAGIELRTSSASRAVPVNGSLVALARDRVRDPAGEPLVAVLLEHPREPRRLVAVDDVRGGHPARLVHPHVERRVLRVGETARGLVQLQGRDAEVEEDALHAPRADTGQHVGDLVVDRVHQRGPLGVRSEAPSGDLEGLRVAVETDQAQPGELLQQRLAVAAHPEGGVDDDGSRLPHRRRQQLQGASQQHGDVTLVRPVVAGHVNRRTGW